MSKNCVQKYIDMLYQKLFSGFSFCLVLLLLPCSAAGVREINEHKAAQETWSPRDRCFSGQREQSRKNHKPCCIKKEKKGLMNKLRGCWSITCCTDRWNNGHTLMFGFRLDRSDMFIIGTAMREEHQNSELTVNYPIICFKIWYFGRVCVSHTFPWVCLEYLYNFLI